MPNSAHDAHDVLSDSEEELSEGKEVRQATKAYAAVAKREVVVLSSDDELDKQEARVKRVVAPAQQVPPQPHTYRQKQVTL